MMGLKIRLFDGEPIEKALRRLKKLVEREGIPKEMRSHIHFVDGTEIRRAKRFKKRFKAREARLHAQMADGTLSIKSLDKAKRLFWKRTGKP